jgi:hypothetical protein
MIGIAIHFKDFARLNLDKVGASDNRYLLAKLIAPPKAPLAAMLTLTCYRFGTAQAPDSLFVANYAVVLHKDTGREKELSVLPGVSTTALRSPVVNCTYEMFAVIGRHI